MANPITVPAFLLPALIRAALEYDVEALPVFEKYGIDLQKVSLRQDKISAEAFNQILLELKTLTDNPALGISYAHHYAYDYIDEVQTFLTTASTLMDGYQAMQWMVQLSGPFVTTRSYIEDEIFHLEVSFIPQAPNEVTRLFAECSFTMFERFGRERMGAPFAIKEIGFRHEDKTARNVYQSVFHCPIRFGCDYDYLLLDEGIATRPLPHSSKAISTMASHQIKERLKDFSAEKTLHERLSTLLTHYPFLMAEGIDQVAKHLHLSPRTLQRQLQHQGFSFRSICQEVKKELAANLIKGELNIEQIADSLGFSDRRSFTRAYQHWFGCTPSQTRKNTQQQ